VEDGAAYSTDDERRVMVDKSALIDYYSGLGSRLLSSFVILSGAKNPSNVQTGKTITCSL